MVGIADDDQLVGTLGEQRQELGLRRVGVLVLVDEDAPAHLELAGQQRRVGQQGVGGRPDQLGRIPGTRPRQRGDIEVFLQERARRDPFGTLASSAERRQLRAVQATLDGAQQQVAQLPGERPRTHRGMQLRGPSGSPALEVAADQLTQHEVLLGTRQQPRRRQPRGDRRHAEHAECVGVKRACHRFAHRATEPGGNPVAQLPRGAPPERQHQQVLDRDAGGDSCHRRLDQRGGLAGTWTGEYEQRTAAMLNDAPLRRVEIRRCGDASTWPHQPV